MRRRAWLLVCCLGNALLCQAQVISGAPPGSLRLLDGYQHETLQGIDTQVGRIWKNGGPEVRYDIGALAGNHARQTELSRWSRRQTVGGKAFTIAMRTDDVLVVTFDTNSANFFVTGIRTQEEMAEILLMLLSY